jgi:hypothetical protein
MIITIDICIKATELPMLEALQCVTILSTMPEPDDAKYIHVRVEIYELNEMIELLIRNARRPRRRVRAVFL